MTPIMIIGPIRWTVILFLILTVIYGILTMTHRSKERTRLKAQYALEPSELSEVDYVALGMDRYNRSLKAKLLLGVYLFPLAAFGVLVYFAHV